MATTKAQSEWIVFSKRSRSKQPFIINFALPFLINLKLISKQSEMVQKQLSKIVTMSTMTELDSIDESGDLTNEQQVRWAL